MKRLFLKALLLLPLFCYSYHALADTPEYYYFDADRTAVKTIYNGKGEVIGSQEYTVTRRTPNAVYGKNTITRSGKDTEATECRYFIDGENLKISMGKDASGKEMFLDYRPAMNSGGGIISGIGFETTARLAGNDIRVLCTITNREVAARTETVSSAAGTWECVRTEYDMELRGKIFGIGIPVNVHVIEWFAPGTGIVRTDVYRRGKLHETRLLTGFIPTA